MSNEEGLEFEDIELDTLESELTPPDGFDDREHMRNYVRSLLNLLDKQTREILTEYYFGSYPDCSDGVKDKCEAIGRHYDLSAERVRQIVQKAPERIFEKLQGKERKKKEDEEWERHIHPERYRDDKRYIPIKEVVKVDRHKLREIMGYEYLDNYFGEVRGTVDDVLAQDEETAPVQVQNINSRWRKVLYEDLAIGDRIEYRSKVYTLSCTVMKILPNHNRLMVMYDNGVKDWLLLDMDRIRNLTAEKVEEELRLEFEEKFRKRGFPPENIQENANRALFDYYRRSEWMADSIAIKWIKVQLADGKRQHDIVQEFNRLHRIGYQEFSSRTGKLITDHTVGKWIDTMREIEPENWMKNERGAWVYYGNDVEKLRYETDDYLEKCKKVRSWNNQYRQNKAVLPTAQPRRAQRWSSFWSWLTSWTE